GEVNGKGAAITERKTTECRNGLIASTIPLSRRDSNRSQGSRRSLHQNRATLKTVCLQRPRVVCQEQKQSETGDSLQETDRRYGCLQQPRAELSVHQLPRAKRV